MTTAEYQKSWKERPDHNFTPRAKAALRLYVSGATRTQREAAGIMGLSQGYLSTVRRTATGKAIEADFDTRVQEKAVSLSALIAKLSEKALQVMEDQIKNGSTEQVKFMAARDILDRNPETSKTNKVALEAFSIGNKDAKAIAAALVEGTRAKEVMPEVATTSLVRVEETHEPQGFIEAIIEEETADHE